jgi:hypothetical protein
MNVKKIITYFIVIVVISTVILLIIPMVIQIYTDMSNYSKRVEQSYDYTKITTPLPRNIAEDICVKFEISSEDPRCSGDTVVYAPDFFSDIKMYFNKLPEESSTYEMVQGKLGAYLIRCSEPDNEGYYQCRYDIRGDGIYPISIHFNKENRYYQIFANAGGS